MVNGALHFAVGALDLGFERRDPRFEFGNRQRIKVLLRDERERVVASGQGLVGVHVAKR